MKVFRIVHSVFSMFILASLSLPASSQETAPDEILGPELGGIQLPRRNFPFPEKQIELPLPDFALDCPDILKLYDERIAQEFQTWLDGHQGVIIGKVTPLVQCALTSGHAHQSCMTEGEGEACGIEILDRMESRVVDSLGSLANEYRNFPANYAEYLLAVERATTTQCEADFMNASQLENILEHRITIPSDIQEDILWLDENQRLDDLIKTVNESDLPLSISAVDTSPTFKEIRLQPDDGLITHEGAYKWELIAPHYYDRAQDRHAFFQTLPTNLVEAQRKDVELSTINYGRIDWNVEAYWNAGANTKPFYQLFPPPAGFKYCSHQLNVFSRLRLCESMAGTQPGGLALSARVMSLPGTKARGWFDFTLSVAGISESATACQKADAGCLPYQSWTPVDADRQPFECDQVEASDAASAMMCGEPTCFQGVLLCQYGENVSGNCRPVGLPEVCGACAGGG